MNAQRLVNTFIVFVMLFSSSASIETKAASITFGNSQICNSITTDVSIFWQEVECRLPPDSGYDSQIVEQQSLASDLLNTQDATTNNPTVPWNFQFGGT